MDIVELNILHWRLRCLLVDIVAIEIHIHLLRRCLAPHASSFGFSCGEEHLQESN